MTTDSTNTTQPDDFFSRIEARIDTKNVRCTISEIQPGSQEHEDAGLTVRVADLTGQGMRLTAPQSKLPEIGHTQLFTFTDSDTGNDLRVNGVVRWIRKGSVLSRKAEIGIEFVDLPVAHRDALIQLAIMGELTIDHIEETQTDDGESTPSTSRVNLYDILGVCHHASDQEVTRAFRLLVKAWHPDRNESSQAPVRFDEIHKAYSVLRDPKLRDRYDMQFIDDNDEQTGSTGQSDQAAA
ncbi:MAG: DnaJ domain-containing protein [Phycisphaerales bacterium]